MPITQARGPLRLVSTKQYDITLGLHSTLFRSNPRFGVIVCWLQTKSDLSSTRGYQILSRDSAAVTDNLFARYRWPCAILIDAGGNTVVSTGQKIDITALYWT